jgi:hypothetical protein
MGAFIDNEVPDYEAIKLPYSHAAGFFAEERTDLVACADLRPEVMEHFGSYEFKEQDIKAATDACDADGKPGPEFVPTVRDKQPNLALLKDAKPDASSLLAGWCPQRHCTEYLNDGFYNNCRSWIIGAATRLGTD